MQTVNDGGGHTPGLENEARHAGRERLAFADRMGNRRDIVRRDGDYGHRYPIRDLRRPTTPSMVSPSARAAKVSAMRCLSTGSASAITSSTDGA